MSHIKEVHPDRPLKCLLISPKFPESAYWNWKEIAHAFDREAMGIPLGLVTMASTLPEPWEIRLMDLNAQEWDEEAWQWAEAVGIGGMIIQQAGIFELIRLGQQDGKFVFVGGADATSQPKLYQEADALVLGEAEVTMPLWLESCRNGQSRGTFKAEGKPDVTQSPLPRFDLLKLDRYLTVNVQFSRGCPFNCEFCDIIELYGRTPRTKTPQQLLRELDALRQLGYRGWVDIVDDNFVGNKRNVKGLLPELAQWCREQKHPFFFSTQASLNLADDEQMMEQMADADFQYVFMGIETPDPELLATAQKRMNAFRPLSERIAKVQRYGMGVTAGFILGFDGESEHAADAIIECIEQNAIPVAMASLLATLPNTQLSRRLAREGRLLDAVTLRPFATDEDHQVLLPIVMGEAVEQSNQGGLKFVTTRDRYEILEDHRRVWTTIYDPKTYFARAQRAVRQTNVCLRYHSNFRTQIREVRGFLRIVRKLWKIKEARGPFVAHFFKSLLLGPSRFNYAIRLSIAYVHFDKLRRRIETGVPHRIAYEKEKGAPRKVEPVAVCSLGESS